MRLWSGSILSRNTYRSRTYASHPEACTQESYIFSCSSSLNEARSEFQYRVLYSYTCMLKDRYTGFTRWYLPFQWNSSSKAHFCVRASLSLWLTVCEVRSHAASVCWKDENKVSPGTPSCSKPWHCSKRRWLSCKGLSPQIQAVECRLVVHNWRNYWSENSKSYLSLPNKVTKGLITYFLFTVDLSSIFQ